MASRALEEGDNRQFALAAMAQAHLCTGENAKALELITEACKEFENGESDPKIGYSIFQVIEGDVALANSRYDYALALAERTIAVLSETGQRVALPDMLRCKAAALTGLGRLEEAHEAADQALAEAESQGSKLALCHIYPVLAEIAEERGQAEDAKELRLKTRQSLEDIANRTGSDKMRSMFMNSHKIKNLMSML